MKKWKIWNLAGEQFVEDPSKGYAYESDTKLDTSASRSQADCPPFTQHLEVPDGVDPHAVVLQDGGEGVKASVAYEGVTYEATVIGLLGNAIALSFDGQTSIADVVAAWNAANPANQVSHNAGDDSVHPASGTASLVDGEPAGLYLAEDADTKLAWEQAENVKARAAKIVTEETTADAAIHEVLLRASPETHLMVAVNHIFNYLKALQAAAGIDDVDMTGDGQTAKAALSTLQSDLLVGVQTLRATRDAAIENFVLPYPDAELPEGHEDDYTLEETP